MPCLFYSAGFWTTLEISAPGYCYRIYKQTDGCSRSVLSYTQYGIRFYSSYFLPIFDLINYTRPDEKISQLMKHKGETPFSDRPDENQAAT